jgi:thiol-disulfide isomerase/thioredoxin
VGEHVKLEGKIALHENKPLFIHFFNPDCPCSRFNVPYFNSLVKKYSNQFSFIVVVINKAAGKTYSERQIQDKYQISVPVSFDQSIADACGTYSTPQAVILDASGNLYYRGNYNKSRFCTDTRSNYAQMAIDSFLNHHPHPMFNQYALKAYGCQLPKCTQ